MRKSFCAILVLAVISISAQQETRSTLFDEVGLVSCDDMLARLDGFHLQLRNNPSAKGFVVLSGANEHLINKLKLEIVVTSGIIQRQLDKSRVTVIRGKETGEAKMSLWLVPLEVEQPEQITSWNLTLPAGTQSQYFHADSDPICNYPTVYKILQELLAANRRLRINVVISEANDRKYRRNVRDIRAILQRGRVDRIRFFRIRKFAYDPSAEFWLLP